MTTLVIPDHMRQRFETLRSAAKHNRLALMSTTCTKTDEPRFVICAVNLDANGGASFVPLGHMTPDDNPYDAYTGA